MGQYRRVKSGESFGYGKKRREPPVVGIYCIKNNSNGKVYIGSSEAVHKRLGLHRARLYANTHTNQHLQRAFNKYGEAGFTASILEQVEKSHLIEREQFWMDELKAADGNHGYNIEPIAGRAAVAPESRAKISAYAKDRWRWDTAQRERFAQLIERNRSPEGRKAISERSKGCVRSEESRAKQSKSFKENPKLLELCRRNGAAKRGTKRSAADLDKIAKTKIERGYYRAVEQLTPDGMHVGTYPSITAACKEQTYSPSHIIDCCKGRRILSYGFIWKYKTVSM
jgi:group I intron endonuclease